MSTSAKHINQSVQENEQKAMVVIVPLVSLRCATRVRRRVVTMASLVFFSFICLSFLASRDGTGGAVAKEKVSFAVSSAHKGARKTYDGEPMGIALSVNGGDVVEQESGKVSSPSVDARDEGATQKKVNEVKKVVPSAAVVVKKDDQKAKPSKTDQGNLVKNYGDSIKRYKQALKKNKKDKEALAGLVLSLQQRGSDADLEALEDLAERHPSFAPVHAARAHILIRQKDTLMALAAWQKAVVLDPGNRDYRLGLAILNDQLERFAEAIKFYQAVPAPLPPEAQARLDYLIEREKE